MGGTFNPIHMGHMQLAEWAKDEVGLDEVWLIPAGISYMKSEQEVAPAKDRLRMTELAVRENSSLRCLDLEIRREGYTYSYETLEELTHAYPGDEFYFILGADCLFTLENWKYPQRLMGCCRLIAAVRDNASMEEMTGKKAELERRFGGEILLVPFLRTSMSSTQIRERIRQGKSVRYLVPDSVLGYMEKNGLYQRTARTESTKPESEMSKNKSGKSDYLRKLRKEMEKEQDGRRYEHTLGVEFTSAALAMRYGASVKSARTAGLLHDCAKCLSDKERVSLCKKYDIPMTELEKANPFLLHAKVGACLAKERYGVTDPDILNAILNHTTGRPGMSLLEKIVFIADYMEPGRNHAPNLEEIRKMAFMDLDQTLLKILEDTLEYLDSGNGDVDPMTRKTWEYYAAVQAGRDCGLTGGTV